MVENTTPTMTPTVRVEPRYTASDDQRAFWLEIRGGIGQIGGAINRRARAERKPELVLLGKLLDAMKVVLSGHLGLE